jgi:hypothetical protein
MRLLRRYWRWIFLGGTATILGLEGLAALDPHPETEPWTHFVTEYIPEEVTFIIIGGLSFWLFKHFTLHYEKKRQAKKNDQGTA